MTTTRGDHRFCDATIQGLRTRAEAAEAKADRILNAYHMRYRHGPDPDPKRCPACHAAVLEDE